MGFVCVEGRVAGGVGGGGVARGRLSLCVHHCSCRLKVSKTLCSTSTETIRLITGREKGGRGYGGGGGKWEIIMHTISLHCHHQNDSCIKMGSDESHFNVR